MRFTILLIATAAAIKIEDAGQYPTNGEPDFEKWCDLTKGEPSPDTCEGGKAFGGGQGVWQRLEGEVGEQATMFFYDPAGNALEFKSFRDMSQLFAK